jgi:hypothetical protein
VTDLQANIYYLRICPWQPNGHAGLRFPRTFKYSVRDSHKHTHTHAHTHTRTHSPPPWCLLVSPGVSWCLLVSPQTHDSWVPTLPAVHRAPRCPTMVTPAVIRCHRSDKTSLSTTRVSRFHRIPTKRWASCILPQSYYVTLNDACR